MIYIHTMMDQSPRCYDFTIYGHGGYLGHMACPIYIKFGPSFLRMIHMKVGFVWPSGFRGKDVLTL